MHAWDHTDDTLARHVARAEAIAEEASSATERPPRPSSMCGWCDFVQHCPEGIEASGGLRKPWEGLGPE